MLVFSGEKEGYPDVGAKMYAMEILDFGLTLLQKRVRYTKKWPCIFTIGLPLL